MSVRTGMYGHVLILTIQSGYAAALLLDSLLQFCPADSAVLETTASNHTNASSSMFQSTAAGPAANLVIPPLPLLAGGVGSAGFSGGAAASAAEAGGGAGAAAAASAGGSTALALASSEGTGMGPQMGRALKQSG